VKNQWYYGWGIGKWLWPKMLIYNVSGFDAGKITLKNGKTYRIGTDEPEKLEQTILQLINSEKGHLKIIPFDINLNSVSSIFGNA